ncbi:MAG: hemerythrin domain-containing protein [Bacteroidetes bacterium]|nr:hemerythrin domain-containing protein [Bacteroidota bacterium]MCB0845577.1 hemerythrin domain-containing protein [Bacteroidota bacterium]MCB0852544.1 hemerythrin domain-containing protein [Bacteroidota bacterium]
MPQANYRKRQKALFPLINEHNSELELCENIRKGVQNKVESDRIAEYTIHYFQKHLIPHFQKESLFLEKLDELDLLRKKAEKQHRRLNRLKEKLIALPKRKEVTLGVFEEELEAHVRFEKKELIPHLQRQLTVKDLEEVCRNLRKKKKSHKEDRCWDDKFWE